MLRVAGGSGDVNEAILRVLEVKPDELSAQWQQAIRDAYKPVALTTKTVSDFATPLVKSESDFGGMSLAPALSPDGKRLAYLSSKDLFSIDLYVVNADNGTSAKKLTRTAVDPHFSSLGFVNGSGARAGWRTSSFLIVPSDRLKRSRTSSLPTSTDGISTASPSTPSA
jgi:hypothetical protein